MPDKTAADKETAATAIVLSGPELRAGVETDLKYGKVRFGIQRDFELASVTLGSEENTTTETKSTAVNFASSGTYSVSTGFGMEYKNLQIDILLNRHFWNHGPQMIFDSQNGAIAASADVIYTFN